MIAIHQQIKKFSTKFSTPVENLWKMGDTAVLRLLKKWKKMLVTQRKAIVEEYSRLACGKVWQKILLERF